MRILLLCMIFLVMLQGCSKEDVRNYKIEKAIFEIVADQSKDEIDLLQLTEFEWDRAFLFAPYTNQEQINKTLGFSFEDKSQIAISDDIYLLVFTVQNRVSAYAEVDRQQADYTVAGDASLSPEHPLITIER